jgi:hypothetical protein
MAVGAGFTRQLRGRRQFTQHKVARFLRRASDPHRNAQRHAIRPRAQGLRQLDRGAQLRGV